MLTSYTAFTEEELKSKMLHSPSLKQVYRAAKNAERMKDWEIGMVLVTRSTRDNQIIKNNAGSPQKYIVVNKIGPLPICKRLMVNGRPGKGLHCPAVDEGDYVTYEEDPEAADALILGYDYDPLEFPKKAARARNRMKNHNNKVTLYKYFEHMFATTRIEDARVRSFIEDQTLLNGGLEAWYMPNDNEKHHIKINAIDSDGNALADVPKAVNVSGKLKIRMYSLTSKYSGSTYFIEEPKTLKEELEKEMAK